MVIYERPPKHTMKLFSFRNLRILILLGLLAAIAIYSKSQLLTSTAWLEPLQVVIYPINADGDPKTTLYIRNLHTDRFSDIDAFMVREGKKFNTLEKNPTHTRLGAEVMEQPPVPPDLASRTAFSTMLWSLKLRYWVWQNTPDDASNINRVRIFVLYYQGTEDKPLQHSLGLQKGLLGIVHAFAKKKMDKRNNIVITHELLHTVGATDKYDTNNQPIYPQGYAQPNRKPRYPQYRAEIMSARIPSSSTESEMASSLKKCVIGPSTAKDINWLGANTH
ncbi:hypothetical protein MNBD_GAMMA26-2161 [hydrothermal vent metagenome]|uniref:Uncharacterized protein n=1 Tax=hydrothermal vent metagenome TaxID=652676 RepID=A0A3B1BW99_9ZZZZ